MPKGQGQGFSTASKILKRHDQDRAFRMHRQKVQEMRAGLNNSPPRRYPHLILRLKQTQLEEEYLAAVDHDNKLLLHNMMRIMQKPRNGVDNWNDYQAKSLNQPYKTRVSQKIEKENLAIARRLEKVQPVYSTDKWEDDHKRRKYLLDLWADETKEYTPRSKGGAKETSRSSKGDDDQYDDDFESEDEEDKEEEKKEDSKGKQFEENKAGQLPEIKQDTRDSKDSKDRHSRRSKSETSVKKLPPVQNRPKQDPKLYMYYGKHFNSWPEEEEDGKPSQAERDAKELFRVAKALASPVDVFIRVLIRRSPKQREMIKNKFHDMYDLDLESELKSGLGKEWHLLIEALLQKPPDGDDDDNKADNNDKQDDAQGEGPHEDLRSALKNGDIPTAVTLISSRNDRQLASLKETYKKEHGISVDSDIVDMVSGDPERQFLLTLVKERREERKGGVQQEATAIYEQGDGRWSSPNGEFLKLLETRPRGHMRAVLKKYHQVSGGTSAVKAVEKECSKDYAQAVQAFLNAKESGKGG